MRICLFWNEAAGEGISVDELKAHIVRAGHTVVRVVERSEDVRDHLHHDFDAVAAAGGDGTIARAARALVGGDVPLGILPLGTANNIATSLAIDGDLDHLIARWTMERVVRIDAGVVDTSEKSRVFMESVGAGLVADCIDSANETIAKDHPETHLRDARQLYIDLLSSLDAHYYSIRIGDHEIEGEYLLVEVLNTPFIGPGVKLTADASAADGLLSVVAVPASERAALTAYFESLRDEHLAVTGFKSWRVPDVEIRGVHRMHVDDRVRDVRDSTVRVRVQPASLRILG